MRTILLFFFLVLGLSIYSQPLDFERALLGYWSGSFVKENSSQRIEIQITQREDQFIGLQVMEEWHPTYGEFEVPIQIDSTQLLTFGTGYGRVKMRLDTNNLEMIGYVDGQTPQLSLHLKREPRRPKITLEAEEVIIANDSVSLHGHLHVPRQRSGTVIIIAGGRGCYADQTKYNLYAKFLNEYGISVLAYQKRGTGQSSGNCDLATIDELADDLVAVKKYLENHPNQYDKIGVIGLSAGGWTMAKAEEKTDFDFMIGIVGPATSVKDQQLQSSRYGAEFYKLSDVATQHLLRYIELLFSKTVTPAIYAEVTSLLGKAEKEGWLSILEDTDKPASLARFDELWVRRHNYDPATTWRSFDKPLLAIFGERDWIVPYTENMAAFEKHFANQPNQLTTLFTHNAEHGLEMEIKYVKLSEQTSYWHFFRISPRARIEIIDFLDKIGATNP
ncbi:MAG: alpha/beta hydrolase [Bacteroidota bacterium]